MADVSPPPAGSADDQPGIVLPTISFHADGAGGELFDALHGSGVLAHLSKEAPGSPIQLRVFHTVRPAHMDAKNFFSGLAAVGTLGLAPVVMTGEHTMHYELYVNGERVVRHDYNANLSRKEYLNSRAADATHGLGPDGLVWAKSTVDLFLADLARDGSVRALNDEYQFYFGDGSPSASTAAGASSANPPSTPGAVAQSNSVASPAAEPTDSTAAPHGESACAKDAPANDPALKEGVAVVQVCVDETGTPTRDPVIVRSSGSCRLDEGAIGVAKSGSGHYLPRTSGDKPVPGCISFKVRFALKD